MALLLTASLKAVGGAALIAVCHLALAAVLAKVLPGAAAGHVLRGSGLRCPMLAQRRPTGHTSRCPMALQPLLLPLSWCDLHTLPQRWFHRMSGGAVWRAIATPDAHMFLARPNRTRAAITWSRSAFTSKIHILSVSHMTPT